MTLQELFTKYKGNATTFIETGTYNGVGVSAALKAGFKEVISFEIDKDLAEVAKHKFKDNPNVQIVNESSTGKIFKQFCYYSTKPYMFWLDAHKMGVNGTIPDDYPLTAEIETICKTTLPHIVLMDDVRLFNRYGTSPKDIISRLSVNNPKYKVFYESNHTLYENDILCFVPEVI